MLVVRVLFWIWGMAVVYWVLVAVCCWNSFAENLYHRFDLSLFRDSYSGDSLKFRFSFSKSLQIHLRTDLRSQHYDSQWPLKMTHTLRKSYETKIELFKSQCAFESVKRAKWVTFKNDPLCLSGASMPIERVRATGFRDRWPYYEPFLR